MKHYVMTVFSNAVAGQEEEYNRWYNNQHLGDVLKIPGFVAAQRFKLAGTDANAPAPYLAIYQVEADDAQQAMARLNERAGTEQMPMTPALDLNAVKVFFYEQITDLKRANTR